MAGEKLQIVVIATKQGPKEEQMGRAGFKGLGVQAKNE